MLNPGLNKPSLQTDANHFFRPIQFKSTKIFPACVFLWASFLFPLWIHAAFDNIPLSNRAFAQMGAGSGSGGLRLGSYTNPASLRQNHWGFHLHYHRPYQLNDLEEWEVAGFYDGSWWGVGSAWRQLALDETYQEKLHLLQFSAAPLRSWIAGFAFHTRVLSIRDYSYTVFPGESFGLQWKLNRNINLGLSATDWIAARWSPVDLQPLLHFGLGIRPHPKYSLELDFFTNRLGHWREAVGQSLHFTKYLSFYTGFTHHPLRMALGVSFGFQSLQWHQSVKTHPVLGKTVGYGVEGEWKRRAAERN